MTDASVHPEMARLQRWVAGDRGDAGVGEHLRACSLCGTLALSFEQQEQSTTVDPSLYLDKRPLRSGGMGKTFLARDVRIGREVVLKEPADASGASDPGASLRMERRLLRERRILGSVEHPAVVPIYESGRWPDGTPFIAMRRILGPTLAEVIAGAPAFAQRIVLLSQFTSIVEAVAHAHARGVIHRDLTPDNMMLGPLSEPYVIDWGIATLADSPQDGQLDLEEPVADGMTRGGIGKEPYAPPEQLAGEPAHPTFDVYSLGATLHHLLAGVPPRRSSDGTLGPVPGVVPDELVSIVRRATAAQARDRFPDAGALATELRRYEQGKLVEAHQYTLWGRARRVLVRHRGAGSIAVALIIAVVAVGTSLRWRRESQEAQLRAAAAQAEATSADNERALARERANAATANRDAAMRKWTDATARSRALTAALEQQKRLSGEEVARLQAAIDAERSAATEAMELRVAAESARQDAEAAARRARFAEERAIAQARSAQEAREAAEQRADEAEARAQRADEAAARARAEANQAIAHATTARQVLEETLALYGRAQGAEPAAGATVTGTAAATGATAATGVTSPGPASAATPAPAPVTSPAAAARPMP